LLKVVPPEKTFEWMLVGMGRLRRGRRWRGWDLIDAGGEGGVGSGSPGLPPFDEPAGDLLDVLQAHRVLVGLAQVGQQLPHPLPEEEELLVVLEEQLAVE